MELATLDRRRTCPEVEGLSRTRVTVSGERRLSFCSNDYLGLADHPALAIAAAAAAQREGFGGFRFPPRFGRPPGASTARAGAGRFLGREAALLFPSGYQTNIGSSPPWRPG